jgi:hypothetical protein
VNRRGYAAWAEAFAIFANYAGEGGEVAAEHDVVYACPDVEEMTEADRKRLEELGWFISEEFECWTRFT